MSLRVRLKCPECERWNRLQLANLRSWQCPHCDHLQTFNREVDPELPQCAVCGNRELYKKKDFPHWLGLTILTLACLAFLWAHWKYDPLIAWAILIGSAAFDGLFYLWVRDVVVCYRCGAEHRGFTPGDDHKPFELTIAERYRQERLRRKELQSAQKKT
jgi:uncharacterized protein (DUF983 family)